jgi:hypothetical protein
MAPAWCRPSDPLAPVQQLEVVLLKKAFVLCLKDEYTDSIRLPSLEGLYVVS